MNPHQPFPDDVMKVRIMVGDPQALAYLWIEAYTENLNSMIDSEDGSDLTVSEVIDVAMTHVRDNANTWGEYIVRGGAFEGFQMDPTFWDKLADLKQIDIPQRVRGSFFSCSC